PASHRATAMTDERRLSLAPEIEPPHDQGKSAACDRAECPSHRVPPHRARLCRCEIVQAHQARRSSRTAERSADRLDKMPERPDETLRLSFQARSLRVTFR